MEDLSNNHYAEFAGRIKNIVQDKENVILVRADGSSLTGGGWLNSVLTTKVMPGDSILVPDKVDLEATWSSVVRNTKDLTQIFYQLGLGAAAIKTLKN